MLAAGARTYHVVNLDLPTVPRFQGSVLCVLASFGGIMRHRFAFPLVVISLLMSFSISLRSLQAQDPLSLIHEPAQERNLLNGTVSVTSGFTSVPVPTEQTAATSSPTAGPRSQRRRGTMDNVGFDPATFVRIYEDTKDRGHLEIHNPRSRRDAVSHLSVDTDSSIVIVPDSSLLQNSDLSLNKLFISAVLASGDKQQNVEVVGYSEIG